MNKKSFTNPIANKRNLLIIAGFIIGVILIVFGSGTTRSKENSKIQNNDDDEMYYSEILESRLEEFLKTVEGIDSVRVFVTVDGGTEYEYAQKGGTDGYASDYLIIRKDSDEEAAVIREIYPKIRGVGISCTGGDDPAVREEITLLLSAALGISTNKIEVAGYDK